MLCIVKAKATDGGGNLSGDEQVKLNKGLGEVRFVFKEIGPHELSNIIDKHDQLLCARGVGNRGNPPDTVVNDKEGRWRMRR